MLAVLASLVGVAPAAAFSIEDPPAQLPGQLQLPDGATSWDLLGKAAVIFGEENGEQTVTTIIPPEVERLDGAAVSLMGYMVPIEADLAPRRFLLVEYPADCVFCLAGTVEPSRIVEVAAEDPIDWHDDPILLAGRLEVVRGDEDGLVYRLHDARLAQ